MPSTFTSVSVRDLIADINAVNKAGGSHTIILAPSTIFELKQPNNTANGATGLPVIGGTKAVDLTIVGNGNTIERIGTFRQGQPINLFRLFDVAPGASLSLDHVTLQGGWAYGSGVAGYGGAIHNQGTLKVTNGSVLAGNRADFGGGIYNAGGTVTISLSMLSGNAAKHGGGIYNTGTLAVGSSTLSVNHATMGGGIYNAGTATISNSTLSGSETTYGGGIYNAGGAVTISHSILSGNRATPDYSGRGGHGGGIYNAGGTVTISHSTLSGNSARQFDLYGYSGGIYNDAAGTVTVENSSSITGNTASSGGDDGYVAQDVYNLGVLYLDSTSTIGVLHGNPAIPI